MSSDLTPRLAPMDPAHPDARGLMAQSEALASRLYPAESNHFEPPEGLRAPQGSFFGCWMGLALSLSGLFGLLALRRTHAEEHLPWPRSTFYMGAAGIVASLLVGGWSVLVLSSIQPV